MAPIDYTKPLRMIGGDRCKAYWDEAAKCWFIPGTISATHRLYLDSSGCLVEFERCGPVVENVAEPRSVADINRELLELRTEHYEQFSCEPLIRRQPRRQVRRFMRRAAVVLFGGGYQVD
ncbi:MAG: hypothetical protein JSS27_01125 [Planctomycetes bacterium]|nr:hypothetical protein [Planctomycetota bacterium]